jgi:hypothetical protein
MEFVQLLVGGNFGTFAINVVVYDILGGASIPEEDAVITVSVRFGPTPAWFLNGDGAAKSTDVVDAGYGTGPCFFGGLTDTRVVICSIV